MKIHPVGAEFNADGQADMTKLIFASSSFPNTPTNWYLTIWPIAFLCYLRFRYRGSIRQANFGDFFQIFRLYKIVLLRFRQKLFLGREN